MKCFYFLLCAAVLCCVLGGCHKMVCQRSPMSYMQLPEDDTTRNSTVTLIKYRGGTNMQKAVDSVVIVVDTYRYASYFFEEGADYKITLMPQGRVHTFGSLRYNKASKTGSPGLSSDMCAESGSYKLDGAEVDIPYLGSYGSGRVLGFKI